MPLRTSRHVRLLDLGGERLVCTHPFFFSRLAIPRRLGPLLIPGEPLRDEAAVAGSLSALLAHGILLADGTDEEALLRRKFERTFLLARERPPSYYSEGHHSTYSAAPDDAPHRVAQSLAILRLDPHNILAVHPFLSSAVCMSERLWKVFEPLTEGSRSRAEFVSRAPPSMSARAADRFHRYLVRKNLLVESIEAEQRLIAAANRESPQSVADPGGTHVIRRIDHDWHYQQPSLDLDSIHPPSPLYEYDLPDELSRLRVCLVGNCVIQPVLKSIELAAFRRGYRQVDVVGHFRVHARATEEQADLFVVRWSILEFLFGTRSDATFDPLQLEQGVTRAKDFLSMAVNTFTQTAQSKLVLFVGAIQPQSSPLGRTDYREGLSLNAAVTQINDHLKTLIAGNPNMLFVDLDQLVSREGKRWIRDDQVVPYRHDGFLDPVSVQSHPAAPTLEESFLADYQPPRGLYLRLLADEVLDAYTLWRGEHPIKLVVVDLDNTLWRGVAGEESLPYSNEFAEGDPSVGGWDFSWGALGGLHEALNVLRHRGIPLAACSRNEESLALRHWTQLSGLGSIMARLTPEDFVAHKVGWKRKSDVIREICQELSLRPANVLFIDDNPVERQEVASSLPAVRVLGSDLNRVRQFLLTDPHLQSNVYTDESRRRPELYKAQVRREADRVTMDEATFLKSLHIQIEMIEVHEGAALDRVAELVQRTNQFNTTHRRYDPGTLGELAGSSTSRVVAARVKDRYSDYGLVACCVIRTDGVTVVESVCMSCRVLPLGVELPILVSALRHLGPALPVHGLLTRTEVNRPCHDLFAQAGFEPEGDGFMLRNEAALPTIDAEVFRVTWP